MRNPFEALSKSASKTEARLRALTDNESSFLEKEDSKAEKTKSLLSKVGRSSRKVVQHPAVSAYLGKMAAMHSQDALEYLQRRNLSEVREDIQELGKKRPGLLLGAAFAAGFLAIGMFAGRSSEASE